MNEREVVYKFFTDDFTNQVYIQVVSDAGALIQLSAPRTDAGMKDLVVMIENFYRYISEMTLDLTMPS